MARILFKTAYNPFTGYGKDGLDLTRALMDADHYVSLSPEQVMPPLSEFHALMLTRPIEPPYDVLIHHTWPDAVGLSPGEMRSADIKVLWTMWEFTGYADDPEHINGPMAERLKCYDIVLGYDDVTLQALKPYLSENALVAKLQGGYWSDDWAQDVDRDWTGVFRFGMAGALHQRKNPFAAVQAFDKLKQEHGDGFNAELWLKTVSKTLHPAMEERYPGLKIFYEVWPEDQMRKFYQQLHAYVAPSWGEGKNLPALEAQSSGIPAIVSDFGGHKEWARSDWAYLIPGQIEEHQPGMGSWRVDVDALAELMWRVYTRRDEARRKGELAKRMIPSLCDWSKVVEHLRVILKELPVQRQNPLAD